MLCTCKHVRHMLITLPRITQADAFASGHIRHKHVWLAKSCRARNLITFVTYALVTPQITMPI